MLEMRGESRRGHGYGDHEEVWCEAMWLAPPHPHVVHIYSTSISVMVNWLPPLMATSHVPQDGHGATREKT